MSSLSSTASSISDEEIKSILARELPRGLASLTSLPAASFAYSPTNAASRDATVPHAPVRTPNLTQQEQKLAVKNALRYFPKQFHAELAVEFSVELTHLGHIYMHRFRPRSYALRAYPLVCYPSRSRAAAALMLMLMNNLDPAVAQYPHELITYGGNGSVLSNWAQYHLLMQYLTMMTDEQTLHMYSGHPHGLFPATSLPPSVSSNASSSSSSSVSASSAFSPRMVITNGMVIPNYSSPSDYDRMYALGVSQYGQMTAGSYCYIGPQGIVHGTTITVLNATRKYLAAETLVGRVYLSSGLGGMSGAQGKAGMIAGGVAVVAEVNEAALMKRYKQGWITVVSQTLDDCVAQVRAARAARQPAAIAYHGNIVDLLERFAAESDLLCELISDQTSLHNPYGGGYYPAGVSFADANSIMHTNPTHFKQLVQQSLVRHVAAVNKLVARGARFWDYGNSFLLEAGRAGADIWKAEKEGPFKYPSYVQEFMGDIFSLGFGPFRWICTSCSPADLKKTDEIAADIFRQLRDEKPPEPIDQQLRDNLLWITQAEQNQLIVGSQARILYADARGRRDIALAINTAIKRGDISSPVVLSRDHHDVSGTDSPFRETSNITDGSQFCADMAVHNCIGDAYRGATWVALHNGGGCGWGMVMNGGFGLVLDGSDEAHARARLMLSFDVNNGITRRAWAGNSNAQLAIERAMKEDERICVTMPVAVDDEAVLERALQQAKAATH